MHTSILGYKLTLQPWLQDMSVLSGVGISLFLLRSYCQMLSEKSHPLSNFQDRAKHPTHMIPPPKASSICSPCRYNSNEMPITYSTTTKSINKDQEHPFGGKIMETDHWRKGEKNSIWVCEKEREKERKS